MKNNKDTLSDFVEVVLEEKELKEEFNYRKVKNLVATTKGKAFSAKQIADQLDLSEEEVENLLDKISNVLPANDLSRGIRGLMSRSDRYIYRGK